MCIDEFYGCMHGSMGARALSDSLWRVPFSSRGSFLPGHYYYLPRTRAAFLSFFPVFLFFSCLSPPRRLAFCRMWVGMLCIYNVGR